MSRSSRLVLLLWLCCLAGTAPVTAAVALQRPAPESLRQTILAGDTTLSQEGRERLAEQLYRLDQVHLAYLRRHLDVETLAGLDLVERTADLPRLTPTSERAILRTLRLQSEMLEVVLRKRDPRRAESLLQGANRVRVLNREREIVFGDFRDLVVAAMVRELQRLRERQGWVGAGAVEMVEFPTHLRDLAGVEAYFRQQLDAALRLANRLGD